MESGALEYIIKRKNDGSLLRARIFLIVGYVLLFSILTALILYLVPPILYIHFLLLALAFCAIVIFVSWRFVCPEYELIFSGGEITVTVIYGKSIRKRLLCLPINSLLEFGYYDEGAYEKLCRASLKKNYVCISSLSAPTIYYALFDVDKERAVIYFEADERAIKYLRQQNSAAARAGNTTNRS
jgi:hypothetical protein